MDEDDTVSVSKGVFVFKNGFKRPKKTKKNKKVSQAEESHARNLFSSNLWYQTYSSLWNQLECRIKDLNNEMFSSVLSNLVNFVRSSHNEEVEEIPTAALLTGINMPDHVAQFQGLSKQIKTSVSPHVACLYSQECQNIKYLVEHMITQFITDEDLSDNEDETMSHNLRKNQMNLSVLQCWFENLPESSKRHLVVIIPDFESFNPQVLQKFILIASWYIKVLPFVFIFGVATSINTLHTSLPYQVTSKIRVKVFNSQPSTVYLNTVLEKVFFQNCPFHLGGKVFNLFTDLFLFYDLSVSNFISNIKYAMAEHFCFGNAMALCTLNKQHICDLLADFKHEDLENLRQLLSFRRLVEQESYENRIRLLEDDDYFAQTVSDNVVNILKYIKRFHIYLRCLFLLVKDLPKAPLGKQIRELYSVAVTRNITKTPEYKECFLLLGFQSKEELTAKLKILIEHLSIRVSEGGLKKVGAFMNTLVEFLDAMNNFNMNEMDEAVNEIEIEETVIEASLDRKQFKERLLGMSKQQNKSLNRYEILRKEILSSISKVFEEYLVEPQTFHFHEIFFFDNISIQNYVVGTHRSAIHCALNDPNYYLQCSCCEIPNSDSIKHCMPDICIAYKLHLECGKMINLYDWLQAFLSIVDPIMVDDDSKRVVSPELQARFTQAVAELEYLGFIKSSKRKADHVARLTWGG